MANKPQGLLIGTIALLCSNILVKGLGFGYRVVLMRLLGPEGVGLIEMVSPLYSFLLVVAGFGIQTALSQITARGQIEERTYLRTAKRLLFASGLGITLLAWLLAPFLIQHFAPDERIGLAFRAIIPAIFIISVASAYRGYFQGKRQIAAIGLSQTLEQLVRVAVGVYLVSRMINLPLEQAVTAASIASVVGESIGFAYLLVKMASLRRQDSRLSAPGPSFSWAAARRMIRFSLPVTASRLCSSAIMMLQAFLIPFCLQMAGFHLRAATEIYGRFAGVAMALLHLPGVFTSALSVSVLPAVAESMTYDPTGKSLLKQRISNSLQATSIFTLPGMLLLGFFADELCSLIFHSPLAAPMLRILTIGGCFLYLQITLSSILQGLGEVKALLINGLISGVVLLGGILLLTPQPNWGILGAAWAFNFSWLCGFLLNLRRLLKISRLRLSWLNIAVKPLTAAAGAALLHLLAQPLLRAGLPEIPALVAEIALIGLTYFLILLLSRGLSIGIWRRIKR